MQRALHGRGFQGTQVENGQIVRREPTRGDVGGVGEMVMGGGLRMPNPRLTTDYLLKRGIDPVTSPGAIEAIRQEPGNEDLTGPRAWNSLLR